MYGRPATPTPPRVAVPGDKGRGGRGEPSRAGCSTREGQATSAAACSTVAPAGPLGDADQRSVLPSSLPSVTLVPVGVRGSRPCPRTGLPGPRQGGQLAAPQG